MFFYGLLLLTTSSKPLYRGDFQKGDCGILCTFGAGYSVGNVILRHE